MAVLAEAFGYVHHAQLENPDEGLIRVTIMRCMKHDRFPYCLRSQSEVDGNMSKFEEGINQDLPFAVYARKEERCQVFATSANVPILNTTMVITWTKHALCCENMQQAWIE